MCCAGGGCTEEHKAQQLSEWLGVQVNADQVSVVGCVMEVCGGVQADNTPTTGHESWTLIDLQT